VWKVVNLEMDWTEKRNSKSEVNWRDLLKKTMLLAEQFARLFAKLPRPADQETAMWPLRSSSQAATC